MAAQLSTTGSGTEPRAERELRVERVEAKQEEEEKGAQQARGSAATL